VGGETGKPRGPQSGEPTRVTEDHDRISPRALPTSTGSLPLSPSRPVDLLAYIVWGGVYGIGPRIAMGLLVFRKVRADSNPASSARRNLPEAPILITRVHFERFSQYS